MHHDPSPCHHHHHHDPSPQSSQIRSLGPCSSHLQTTRSICMGHRHLRFLMLRVHSEGHQHGLFLHDFKSLVKYLFPETTSLNILPEVKHLPLSLPCQVLFFHGCICFSCFFHYQLSPQPINPTRAGAGWVAHCGISGSWDGTWHLEDEELRKKQLLSTEHVCFGKYF